MSAEADQFFDSLNYVFQFLRTEGFSKAEETLRLEISSRFEIPDEGSNDPGDPGEDYIHDHPGPPTPAVEEPNLPDPRIGLSNVASAPSAPPSFPAPTPSPSSPAASPSTPSNGRIANNHASSIPEVLEDEYENMDDAGYYRREVIGQQQFVDTELVLSDEEDGRDTLSHGSPPIMSPVSPQSPVSPRSPQSPQSPQSQSSSGTAASLQYSSEQPRSHSPVSISASEPPVPLPELVLDEDESWALGPTDIKIVDPVIAVHSPVDDYPVPTLRRVESLSNSFKDDNDGLDSCANSHVESDFDQNGDQDSTFDLLPAAPQAYIPEFKGVFDSVHDVMPGSPTSSLDVQQSEISDAELGGQKATLIIQTITNNSNREDGFGGGFSFPITPPTSEPDQLFSSWPSFRSPTSEASPDLPGTSDDESQAMLDADVAAVFPVLPGKSDINGTAEIAVLSWPELTAHMISLSMEDYTEADGGESDVENGATSRAAAMLTSPAVSPPPPPPPAPAVPELTVPQLVLPEEDANGNAAGVAHAEAGLEGETEQEAEASAEPTEELSPRSRRTWELTASAEASTGAEVPAYNPGTPTYVEDEDGKFHFVYNEDFIQHKYEIFTLNIIHRRHRTGFEESKDFPIRINDLIAGRYQVLDCLGSAAFSRAVQALDIKEGTMVCLKIIKNNKDYFDQSLDEIKLLHHVNNMDPNDEHGIVRLYDYFYYKEHLFLVCELLRANLYEFQKFNRESNDPPYFTLGRIQKIAIQVLRSLQFLHSLDLVHSDLKPENILIKSYSNCEVKVIDLGSSCFITDHLSSYVQSRSYRAPEVILGLPYDHKIDIWSLGCILAELSSGYVLFQNDSLATLLARLEGILGPIPSWMIQHSKYGSRFYTRSGMLYEVNPTTKRYEILVPKRTSLKFRMPDADEAFCDFVHYLLGVDPHERPTATEALNHPWLQCSYPDELAEV